MRGYRGVLAGAFCILFLAGCGETVTTPVETEQAYCKATVLEVNERTLLVEPLESEEERKSSDRISVGTDGVSEEDSLAALAQIQMGDVIEIGYDGRIMESYPAQIDGVFAVEIVEE